MICNINLKQLKNKLKETLKDKNERDNLEMLVEAWRFSEHFCFFYNFGANFRNWAKALRFFLKASNDKWLTFLESL